MFSSIFQRNTPAPHQNNDSYDDEGDDTTATTTSTHRKSILRRSGISRKNKIRNVSWSETFETLEHDVTYEDTFEQREDESLIEDFNWVYNGESVVADDETRETFEEEDGDGVVRSYYQEEGTYVSSEAMTGEEVDASREEVLMERTEQRKATISPPSDEPRKIDNNENLELRNLACTSNVSDATELTDKYGLTEDDAKRSHTRNNQLISCDSYISDVSTIGDKYNGLDCDESDMANVGVKCSPAVVRTMAAASALAPEDQKRNPPITKEANVFVPVMTEPPEIDYDIDYAPSNDSLTVGTPSAEELGNSFDDENLLPRHVNSDEGSLASLKNKEHGYEEIIRDQNKADKSHGHIGLILPFLSRLQCGAFMEDTSIFKSWEEDVQEEDFRSRSHGNPVSTGEVPLRGYQPLPTGVLEELPSDVPDNEIEVVDQTIICLSDEEHVNAGKISSRKIDELDAKFDTVEAYNEEDGAASTTSYHGQSMQEENSRESSDSSNRSSKKSSRSSHSPPEHKTQKSIQSDEESPLPTQIGNIVSFHAAEDDSIPSNESEDNTKRQTMKTKKSGFNPLASFRKRVSRAATSIVSKNSKSKNSNSKSGISEVQNTSHKTPRIYSNDTLHDKVYHEIRPERQARLSTANILNDLQIIEDTAKVMYQDRFNNTPSLLDPVDDDDDAGANTSMSMKKTKGKVVSKSADDASQRTKGSIQSSLSRIFDDYFQCNK